MSGYGRKLRLVGGGGLDATAVACMIPVSLSNGTIYQLV